jgi:hypothetical protein
MGGQTQLNISEIDCIFISYDEPNAEYNWADLSANCMWAKRVHGVKGSDECHKAAARLSDTEWFITVDGDNIVNPKFFEQIIEVPANTQAMSWPGLNSVNGLRYGNGSLKVWRKDFVLNMKTHESANDEKGQVDFCWEEGYRPMIKSYSTSFINASPFQAWRAGFREGVKMSLVNGVLPKDSKPDNMFWHNLQRLKVWMSVGVHVNNGAWAMLGARHGCYKTNCTDWNHVDVRDFEKLSEIWNEVKNSNVADALVHYGQLLKDNFALSVPILDNVTSAFTYEIIDNQFRQMIEQTEWIEKRNNV